MTLLLAADVKRAVEKTHRELRNLEAQYADQKRALEDVLRGLERICPHSEGWSRHPDEFLEACNLCGFVQ